MTTRRERPFTRGIRRLRSPLSIAGATRAAEKTANTDTGGCSKKNLRKGCWSVYLILSSHLRRTYVGVTTDLSRRLKQHNGELKGGAKASRAGRPWIYACIIHGFDNKNEACEFEAKWKNLCRKLPRKHKKLDDDPNSLLRHREEALSKVKHSFDHRRLQIEWTSISSSVSS